MATGAERAKASRERKIALLGEAFREAERARAREYSARKPRTPPSNPCRNCGEMKSGRGRFCMRSECVLARNRERQRRYAHERRARVNENHWEPFEPVEVYERDGWVCGICDVPVDSTLTWPDPLSVSLDHIVPVSLGGPHTRLNTRCSHLGCNSRRGNRATFAEMFAGATA